MTKNKKISYKTIIQNSTLDNFLKPNKGKEDKNN